MSEFLDKFGLIIATAVVGVALIVCGALFDMKELLGMGILAVGGALGLPVSAKWSLPVIDPELKK